ncbi:MAG: hypothetical protein M0P47_12645 [Bacteroidales bacterium]|nr:hypothetical protein [Bacteroidales bacterium]
MQTNEDDKIEIVLTVKAQKYQIADAVYKLKEVTGNKKDLLVEIKQFREKRSLDANSYCWLIIGKIADVLRANKDDIYIDMLKRYGQRESKLVSVVSEAKDIIYRATKNHCAEVGESENNGVLFTHFAILIGSSEFDTKSMSILIDGIVSEAKELDIETETPEKLSIMKVAWK